MLRISLLALIAASASAFSPSAPAFGLRQAAPACSISMQAEGVSRRDFFKAAAFGIAAAPLAANALVEYPGIPYLGGSDIIDVNNANIRVYTKLPGMYPNIAKKIVKKAPYKDINSLAEQAGLTADEAAIVDKYLPNLVALESAPEYLIDNINNGLYR